MINKESDEIEISEVFFLIIIIILIIIIRSRYLFKSYAMSKITFNKTKSQKSTVNNLLNSILPGHSVVHTASSRSSQQQSATEVISKFNKRLTPQEIHRLNKKTKAQIKKQSQSQQKSQKKLTDQVKLSLIKSTNVKQLTKLEKTQYKQLLAKQISSVLSLAPDSELTEEIQSDIISIVNPETKRKNRKVQGKTVLYKKKAENKGYAFKGLTPGLAPVDMEDPDSDED